MSGKQKTVLRSPALLRKTLLHPECWKCAPSSVYLRRTFQHKQLVSPKMRSLGAENWASEPGISNKEKENASVSADLRLATESSSSSAPNHYQRSLLATHGAVHEKLAVQRWGVGGNKFSDLFCECWVMPAGMEVSTLLPAQNPPSHALWLMFPSTTVSGDEMGSGSEGPFVFLSFFAGFVLWVWFLSRLPVCSYLCLSSELLFWKILSHRSQAYMPLSVFFIFFLAGPESESFCSSTTENPSEPRSSLSSWEMRHRIKMLIIVWFSFFSHNTVIHISSETLHGVMLSHQLDTALSEQQQQALPVPLEPKDGWRRLCSVLRGRSMPTHLTLKYNTTTGNQCSRQRCCLQTDSTDQYAVCNKE